jgi:excinuclease UvrABC nuclease subunit
VKRKESFTVSFRLDPVYLRKLDDEAGKFGLSVHERARQLVISALDETQGERTFEKLIETLEEVRSLRDDLAEAVNWMVKNLQTK